MANVFAILEDNADRAARMTAAIHTLLPATQVHIEDDAELMTAWLASHLHDVVAISLDHDLPVSSLPDGTRHDHGDGMRVATFLASLDPTCPVIVHTSNAAAGVRMVDAIASRGWPVERVHPLNSSSWVDGEWRGAVIRLRDIGWLPG